MTYWEDKVVVITGASAGLGLELAKACVDRRANVALVARDPQRLAHTRSLLGERSVEFPADITVQDQVDALRDQVLSRFDRIDCLVNCAGRSMRRTILETTPEDFQQLWELNFLGLVRCSRAFVPSLIASKGHLVNIGSLASKTVSRYLGAYPASKYPVAAYSQQLRLELGDQGLHVLLACPGPMAREDAGLRYEDTDVPEAARQPGGGAKLKGLDPAWVASRILDACQRRQLELVMPAKSRLLFVLSQMSPRWGDWLVRKMSS